LSQLPAEAPHPFPHFCIYNLQTTPTNTHLPLPPVAVFSTKMFRPLAQTTWSHSRGVALNPSTRAAVTQGSSAVRPKSTHARLAVATAPPPQVSSFAWNGTILPKKMVFSPKAARKRVASQKMEVPFSLSYAGFPLRLKEPAEGRLEGEITEQMAQAACGNADVQKLKEIMSALKQSNFLRFNDIRLGSESGFSETVSRHNIKELVDRLTWSGSLWELGTDDRALVEEARLLIER